jgi:hypothetical protein
MVRLSPYDVSPVTSFGIRNRNPIGKRVPMVCTAKPSVRLSNCAVEMFKADVRAAPRNDPSVEPRLLMDMNRANSVPSIPGGQSCPDRIRNGIILTKTIFWSQICICRRISCMPYKLAGCLYCNSKPIMTTR